MTSDSDSVESWFALRVRPRAEKRVAIQLRDRGYDEFLPLSRQRRRWSDRITEVDFPLFPGYVFARFAAVRRLPILMLPGVIEVVGCGKVPMPIDEAEMRSLQTVVRSALDVEPWPGEFVGRRVRLLAGPLAGAEGTLTEVRQRSRLIVTISLLQRSVSVEVPEHDAWPVDAAGLSLTTFVARP